MLRAYTCFVVDEDNKSDGSAENPRLGGSMPPSQIDTVILESKQGDLSPPSTISTEILGPDDPDATLVEQRRGAANLAGGFFGVERSEVYEAGREFFAPVQYLIGEHATRVQRVRALVRDLDSSFLRALLILQGLSLIAVVGTVTFIDVPSASLYIIMEFLMMLALLRYVRASVDGTTFKRWRTGIMVAFVLLLWAGLLHQRIAPEPLWHNLRAGSRVEMPHLWAPILAHIITAMGLLAHLPLRRYLRRRRTSS